MRLGNGLLCLPDSAWRTTRASRGRLGRGAEGQTKHHSPVADARRAPGAQRRNKITNVSRRLKTSVRPTNTGSAVNANGTGISPRIGIARKPNTNAQLKGKVKHACCITCPSRREGWEGVASRASCHSQSETRITRIPPDHFFSTSTSPATKPSSQSLPTPDLDLHALRQLVFRVPKSVPAIVSARLLVKSPSVVNLISSRQVANRALESQSLNSRLVAPQVTMLRKVRLGHSSPPVISVRGVQPSLTHSLPLPVLRVHRSPSPSRPSVPPRSSPPRTRSPRVRPSPRPDPSPDRSRTLPLVSALSAAQAPSFLTMSTRTRCSVACPRLRPRRARGCPCSDPAKVAVDPRSHRDSETSSRPSSGTRSDAKCALRHSRGVRLGQSRK